MAYYAGMDIGGSYARLALANADGRLLGEYKGEGASMSVVDKATAKGRFAAIVQPALAAHGLAPAGCAGLCVAASGVDTPALTQKCREIFEELGFPPASIMAVNDCQVYLLEQPAPSVVLTVGTGSIAFGRRTDGGMVRCGGWGHLLSDEGSGFSMGLRVLRAVGNHLDGRTPCPVLYGYFEEASPLRGPVEINQFAAKNLNDKKTIARFAPLLDEAAEEGDPIAADILATCIEEYCGLVMDTAGKLDLPNGDPAGLTVLLWGSVLTHSRIISTALREKLARLLPGATITSPPKTALQTALSAAFTIPGGGHTA